MREERWEHFEHGADIGVRGIARSKAAAFEQAALALTAVITEPGRVQTREAVTVSCSAPEDGLLLADWLNALVYEMATRRLLFGRFEVELADHRLTGRAWGEPMDVQRHEPAVEVKGATYTSLAVHLNSFGEWVAQCVVDV